MISHFAIQMSNVKVGFFARFLSNDQTNTREFCSIWITVNTDLHMYMYME